MDRLTDAPSVSDLPTATGDPDARPTHTLPARALRQIGPYRVLQLLGQGGMGDVYLAEQTEPVERKVAIKLIRTNLAGPLAEARFSAERQAMARLSHPNVAQMFEAGTTPDGFPYFVMEHVAGSSLITHCDRRRLNVEQRLELFLDVCSGVQHAHQKGIIHRDLKPTNLLVAEVEGRPVPKVIDFGIAKALDQPLVDGQELTAHGVIGTPAYMSPEALRFGGCGSDVDTRTDVYALGVLLCELLTGSRPHTTDGVALSDLVERVNREDARRPSTLLAELDEDTQSGVAELRGADPVTLASRLRGDLDWIVMKAVARDREERYGSAAELADDLRRSLTNRPVHARPPTAMYRLRKFVRRNALGVAAGVSVTGLILAFAVTSAVQARRIAAERDRANAQAELAEQVSRFLMELFEVSNPENSKGEEVTARDLLDRGADRIDTELADQPEIQARLMSTIGAVYESAGLFEDAERLLRRALEAQRRLLGPDHPDTLDTFGTLNEALYRQGKYDELETLDPELLQLRLETLGEDHPDTLDSFGAVGVLRLDQGDYDAAEELFERAIAASRRLNGASHPDTLSFEGNLAALRLTQGRPEEAAAIYGEVLEAEREALGPEARTTLTTESMLGVTLHRMNRLDEAEPHLRHALEGRIRILGPTHDGTLMSVQNLAVLLADQGDLHTAEAMLRELVETRLETSGESHPWTVSALHAHGRLLLDLGRLDEAGGRLQRALEARRRRFGDDHPTTLGYERTVARLRLADGRPAEALAILERNLAATRAGSPDPADLAEALVLTGRALLGLERHADAEAVLAEADGVLTPIRSADDPDLVECRSLLEKARGGD